MGCVMENVLTLLKQQLPFTRAPAPPPYECQGCVARFGTQYYVCPACGGYTIERTH